MTDSEWMDAFFASYYAHRPVSATYIGVRGFDDRLPDFSEEGAGDALADAHDLLRSSGGDSIDARLGRGFLRIQNWELRSAHFHRGNPSLYTREAVFSVTALFLSDFGPIRERVEAATARTDAIRGFLQQARRNVRRAPTAWTGRAIRECDGAVAFLSDGISDLAAQLDRDSGVDARGLVAAAERAATAFAEHRARLESDLLSRPSEGWACGPEALDLILREGHFLQAAAPEIARYAEDRLEDAEAHLAEHAVDFAAITPADVLRRLANRHPSTEEYYGRYWEVWDDVRRASEEKALLTWPDLPIRYLPLPAWARAVAPHLRFPVYRDPAALGRAYVHDYLVEPLPDGDVDGFLRAHNDSMIKVNHVIRHGGLGHHVRSWHALGAESRIGRMAAVDCASRIAMHCGGTMAGGWACYATGLAAEAGMLTPLEEYGEVRERVRMAARAVVDVCLHLGEMTLEDAAGFYEVRAGMSAAAARAEAVENSMFPGMALIDQMGADTIHRLRAETARRTGPDFDLRRFHDTFLSHGSIPVSLIAEEMQTPVSRTPGPQLSPPPSPARSQRRS